MNRGLATVLLLSALVLAGCGEPKHQPEATLPMVTSKEKPIEVKIVQDPGQVDRIKKLEARIETLENWAVRQGGKFK